jgi:hypothetical protein
VRARGLVSATTAAIVSACGDPTGTTTDGTVRAVTTRSEVRVTNRGQAPVFVAVIGREVSALIDWYPCVHGALCPPPIAQGDTRTVPRPTFRDRPEREANVYWWRAVTGPDGVLRPDSVRVVTVRFP